MKDRRENYQVGQGLNDMCGSKAGLQELLEAGNGKMFPKCHKDRVQGSHGRSAGHLVGWKAH